MPGGRWGSAKWDEAPNYLEEPALQTPYTTCKLLHILLASSVLRGGPVFTGAPGTVLSSRGNQWGTQQRRQEKPATRSLHRRPRAEFSSSGRSWRCAALLLAAGAVALRLIAGPDYDGLLMLAACLAAVLLALRLPSRNPGSKGAQKRETDAEPVPSPTQEILDSAGTAVVAVGLDRKLIYVNPAGERLLGSDASELVHDWTMSDFLAPGEGARLVKEMEKLCGVDRRRGAHSRGPHERLSELPARAAAQHGSQLRRAAATQGRSGFSRYAAHLRASRRIRAPSTAWWRQPSTRPHAPQGTGAARVTGALSRSV